MAEPTIASHLPGRLRLRGGGLRAADRNRALCAELAAWPEVIAVTGNPTAGSVLVRYDPAAIGPIEMAARFAAPLTRANSASSPPTEPALRRLNRASKPLMLLTMAASLAALGTSRKLHAALGVAHLAALAVHLIYHRRSMLR